MILYYTFHRNGREYDFEFEVDYSNVIELIRADLETDGIDPYDDENEDVIDEYIENAMDDIKSHFENEAKEIWLDELEYENDPLGYYGFSIRDFI